MRAKGAALFPTRMLTKEINGHKQPLYIKTGKRQDKGEKGVCTIELSDVEGEKCAGPALLTAPTRACSITKPSKNPDRFQGGF